MLDSKKMVNIMLGLTVFSGCLFAYDNVYLENKNESIPVYVAKVDISGESTITKDLIDYVLVPKNTVEQMPEKFITNDEVESKLIGKQLRGGLVKGEFISEDRVIDKEDENFIEVKLILDGNSTPVNQNDFVNIYVVGNVRGEVSIQRVFEQKRVNKKTTVEENEGQRVTYISLDLTEKEAMTYLKAKELGKIVAVKNNNLDKKEETKDVESFKEADIIIFDENKTELTEIKETVGMITTIFKEGDTLEDLAIKHKTNVATIIELNEGKQYFEINENIVLPSI